MNILIAAASGMARAGLRALLAEHADFCIAGDAGRALTDWTAVLSDLRPDVVVAEDGPAFDRAGLLLALRESGCGLVLIGDAPEGWRDLAGAHLSGWAFLLRDADGGQIAAAVRAVAAGMVVLDRELAIAPASFVVPLPVPDTGEALTPRERDVLQLLARGLPNKQIAARLGITAHTVKFHVGSVLAKLGAESRTEAVTKGARRGDVLL